MMNWLLNWEPGNSGLRTKVLEICGSNYHNSFTTGVYLNVLTKSTLINTDGIFRDLFERDAI